MKVMMIVVMMLMVRMVVVKEIVVVMLVVGSEAGDGGDDGGDDFLFACGLQHLGQAWVQSCWSGKIYCLSQSGPAACPEVSVRRGGTWAGSFLGTVVGHP